jgi:hypothetical protein
MKVLLPLLLFIFVLPLTAQHPYSLLRVQGLEYLLFGPEPDIRFGVIDQQGKVLIPPKYAALSDFGPEGAVAVLDTVYGFVSPTGEEQWFPKLKKLYRLEEGLAPAMKDGKWGFVNQKGKTMIKFKYDMVMPFHEGYAPVKTGKTWKLIDKKGDYLQGGKQEVDMRPVYNSKFVFLQPDIAAKKPKKGLMDLTGKTIIPAIYDDIAGYFSDGLCWVKKGDKEGFVNQKGEEVILDDNQYPAQSFQGLPTPIVRGNRTGYMDTLGHLIIPATYLRAYGFSEGLAAVIYNAKLGFIDANNQLVIPAVYNDAWQSKFQQGRAAVMDGKTQKFGYIDKTGKWLIPPTYDSAGIFENGYAVVKKGRKCGLIDLEGHEIIPCTYKEVWPFSFGKARFVESR